MRIGTLAAAADTTTRTLRYYEQEGLLTSSRSANGYRDYGDDALRRVRNIRELLATGFTIGDVRTFLAWLDRPALPPVFADRGGCTAPMRVADERLTTLRERIDALVRLHDGMAARLGRPQYANGRTHDVPPETMT